MTVTSGGQGTGTEVVVRLPTLDQPAGPPVPEPSTAPGVAPRRILIIEDNPDSRETLRLLLAGDGHQVETADDGPAGLERLRAARPHIALVDLGLPGMDGYQVARAVRLEMGPDPYLIAVTGYGRARDVERAREAGFDAHLVKPVDFGHLRGLIAGMTRRVP